MLEFIKSLPEQLEKTAKVKPPKVRGGPYQNVVFTGMGGSAISGDMVRLLLYDEPIHIEVIRDYLLPGYVDENTLLIVTSYSGNTEETISTLREGNKRGSKLAVITSNGELENLAHKYDLPVLKIPGGYPPRGALGWLLGNSLKMLAGANIIDNTKISKELKDCASFIRDVIPEMEDLDSDTRDIAEKFYLRIPVIYAYQRFYPIAYRWQTQINENAKAFAHSHALSEMNHNEIAGLKNPQEKVETMWTVFLKTGFEHERILKRIEYTMELTRDSVMGSSIVEAKGENLLDRMLYLVLFGDFVSFFLAQAYQEDSVSIPRIDMLKEKLSK